ncbi:MAG: hypothetical protein AB7O24_13545 [Kofleriaceae bacterium]
MDTIGRAHEDELGLARACAAGDPVAVAALRASYLGSIRRALVAAGAHGSAIEDMVQETLMFLLSPTAHGGPRIGRYGGRGSLATWIRITVTRFARRQLDRPAVLQAALDSQLPDLVNTDPELALIRTSYLPAFERALASALRAASPVMRTLLRKYFLERETLSQLGTHYGVEPSTVMRRIQAARRVILATTRQHLADELPLTDSQFHSLAAVLRSRLDPAIGSALRTSGAA